VGPRSAQCQTRTLPSDRRHRPPMLGTAGRCALLATRNDPAPRLAQGQNVNPGAVRRGRALADSPGGRGFAAHIAVGVPLDAGDVDTVLNLEGHPAD
jgi:hypothetical protein